MLKVLPWQCIWWVNLGQGPNSHPASQPLPLLCRTGGENRKRKLLTNYCGGQNKLDLGGKLICQVKQTQAVGNKQPNTLTPPPPPPLRPRAAGGGQNMAVSLCRSFPLTLSPALGSGRSLRAAVPVRKTAPVRALCRQQGGSAPAQGCCLVPPAPPSSSPSCPLLFFCLTPLLLQLFHLFFHTLWQPHLVAEGLVWSRPVPDGPSARPGAGWIRPWPALGIPQQRH